MNISYIPTVEEALRKARSMSEIEARLALAEGVFGPSGCEPHTAVQSMLSVFSETRREQREAEMLEIAKSAKKDARDARIIALIAAAIAAITAIVTAYIKVAS